MTKVTKEITNKDILENLQNLMQMASEGFDRLDHRIDGLEARVVGVEGELHRQSLQLNEFTELAQHTYNEELNIHNDIKEIFDRLLAIEKRLPDVVEQEIREVHG